MRAFIQRHSVATYFVLAFGIAWGCIVLVVGPASLIEGYRGEGLLVGGVSGQAALMLLAMLVGPSVASILTTLLVDGTEGLSELWSRVQRWRVAPRWYAEALLTTPVVILVVLVRLALVDPSFTIGPLTAGQTPAVLIGTMVAGLIIGFCEELGWTGFALPRLLVGHSAFAVAIWLGVVHTFWHGLADWWGNVVSYGGLYPLHFLLWVGALIGLRLLIVHIYQHTESVLLAQLTHASSTGTQMVLTPLALTNPQALLWYALFVLVLWLAVGLIALADRPRAAHPRLHVQPA